MGAKVVLVFFQLPDDLFKLRIPVKVARKEKRTFYFFLSQCSNDKIATVGKFVTGKYKGNIFLCCITADYCAM